MLRKVQNNAPYKLPTKNSDNGNPTVAIIMIKNHFYVKLLIDYYYSESF